jgi:hypothetical protein
MASNIVRVPASGSRPIRPQPPNRKTVAHKPARYTKSRKEKGLRQEPLLSETTDRSIRWLLKAPDVNVREGDATPMFADELVKLVTRGSASRNVERLMSEATKGADSDDGRPVPNHFSGFQLSRMMVSVPRFYNADANGVRRHIETTKFDLTVHEIKLAFHAFTRLRVSGWTLMDGPDSLIRYEIDCTFNRRDRAFIKLWKRMLEDRFVQREIDITFVLLGRVD